MSARRVYLLLIAALTVPLGGWLAHFGWAAVLRSEGTGEGFLGVIVGAFGLVTAGPGLAALALLQGASRFDRRRWLLRAIPLALAAAACLAVVGIFGLPG